MAKKYYEILEISETATSEEIKSAYRKLSLKYHPDRQHGKSLEEKEVSNEKMKEINKAYEVLGDEELRKRYDLGETNFTSDFAGSTYEAEMEDIKEKIRRKQEEINLMEELVEKEGERIKIMEEMWLLNAEYIDRYGTYNEISASLCFSFPRVYAVDLKSKGYSKLWEPYKDWLDKVWKIPITLKRGVKEESDELKKFKEEMFKAIKEVETIIETRKKDKEKERAGSSLERDRVNAIEAIKRELRERELKAQDLGEYSNYQEQINNLDKQWKVRSLRDKVKEYIRRRRSEESKFEPRKDANDKGQVSENRGQPIEYADWTKEELIGEIKQKQLDNNQLQKIITSLEAKIKELEKEIAELKAEKNQTSDISEQQEIQKEIEKKEVSLQKLKSVINYKEGVKNTEKSGWNLKDVALYGGIGLGVVVLLVIAWTWLRKYFS